MSTQRVLSCSYGTGFMSSYQDTPEVPCEKVSGQPELASSQKAWRLQVCTGHMIGHMIGERGRCLGEGPEQERATERGKF